MFFSQMEGQYSDNSLPNDKFDLDILSKNEQFNVLDLGLK